MIPKVAPMTGEELRAHLEERAIRRPDFAAAMGIHIRTVTNWLDSGVPTKRIRDVREMFGLPSEATPEVVPEPPQPEPEVPVPGPPDLSGMSLSALYGQLGRIYLELGRRMG